MTVPDTLRRDPQLRELLLTFYLETFSGLELADWLKDLGQDSRGSIEEKQRRIRAHTQYLTMPAAEFPDQTQSYLERHSSELLASLCEDLGVSTDGTKDQRYRRIMREVHYREGWLTRVVKPITIPEVTAAMVAPVLGWVPLPRAAEYEKQFYPVILDELREVFGNVVYEQFAVSPSGSTLKIDFHVGDPRGHGVGVEVKLPTNATDVQRAKGQLEDYQRRYGDNLILLIVGSLARPDILDSFIADLKEKKIATIVR